MKQIMVKIPDGEFDLLLEVQRQFPGVSMQLIFRALALTAGRIAVGNALAKHASVKAKGGFGEKEK